MADKFAALPPALLETRPRASKLDLSTSTACAPSEERPQSLVLESWRSQDSQCHFQPPAKSESVGSCIPASAPSPVPSPIWKSRRAILESKDRGSREARYRHTFARAPKTQVPSSTLCKSSTGARWKPPHHYWRSCSLRDLLDLQQCLVQLAARPHLLL